MLDLQAGVHFEEKEVVAVGVVDKFHGASGTVVYAFSQLHRRSVKRGPGHVGKTGCRSFLEDFLVAALHRAVALAEC